MLSACTLVSIFSEQDGRLTSDLITEISGVAIEKSDLLSKKICKECESKVLELHAFRQLCIDSDETVRYNLLLAEGSESVCESSEIVSYETLQKDEDENQSQLEEYFIEEDESDATNVGYKTESDHAEYEAMFDHDENEEKDDQIIIGVESLDECSMDVKYKDMVMIERLSVKENEENSTVFEPGDDLTMKMREAHFAKEQQKKHKCPHCDKFFMFPSKGWAALLSETHFLMFSLFQSTDMFKQCTRISKSRRRKLRKIIIATFVEKRL
jgi:Zinc-finger associated domain (zf-AD)